MFEQIFDEYRKAVDSSLKMQEEMYRQWMNGWPIKPPDVTTAVDREGVRTRSVLPEEMEPHPRGDDGEASRGAQRTVQERDPGHRIGVSDHGGHDARGVLAPDPGVLAKSIDSYKSTFEAQGKYVQDLAQMWMDMMTRGKA